MNKRIKDWLNQDLDESDTTPNEEKYELKVELDKTLRLEFLDFSHKCSRPDMMIVHIMKLIEGHWQKIGEVRLLILNKTMAELSDFAIGSDEEYLIDEISNPDHKFRILRGKGIGGKTLQNILSFLRSRGIEQVFGEISKVDDVEKVANFWRKNGFIVNFYAEPKGFMVAEISKDLRNT